jgi:hypothetical protein
VLVRSTGADQRRRSVHVDAATGVIDNKTRGTTLAVSLPPFLLAMIADGGLVPHLEKRFADKRAAAQS